jgi:hypothetical protein
VAQSVTTDLRVLLHKAACVANGTFILMVSIAVPNMCVEGSLNAAWAKLGKRERPYISVSSTAAIRYRLPLTQELNRICDQFIGYYLSTARDGRPVRGKTVASDFGN